MSAQHPSQLNAVRARLRAAEAHLASATDRLLQTRRQALHGAPDATALAAALAAYLEADAAAQEARREYERLTGTTTAPALLAAARIFLGAPAPAAPATSTPRASDEEPEPYVPAEQERRRWQFARWLAERGQLTEYPV